MCHMDDWAALTSEPGGPIDRRLEPAPVVTDFAARVRDLAGLVGLYAGGSLATGDYRPGVSDLDLVVVLEEPPSRRQRRALTRLHRELVRSDATARGLHCAYLPLRGVEDLTARHWTWAFNELFRRPVSGIARAELLVDPVVVLGPPPVTVLPAMGREAVAAAARGELAGYWSATVCKPRLWLQDVYVDLGLLTLVRAEAAITEGRLVTKAEALGGLHRFGVEPDLVEQIRRRREGEEVTLTPAARRSRADRARALMSEGIRRLCAQRAERTSGGGSSYDAEARVYDETRGGQARAEAAAAAVHRLVEGRGMLLDVAGGTGIVTVELARTGLTPVLVDLSLGMLDVASTRLPGRVLAGSATRLPVRDGCVDVVAMVWLLHLLAEPDADRAVAEAVRVLRPGGWLVTTVDKNRARGRSAGDADERERLTGVARRLGLTREGDTTFNGTPTHWDSVQGGGPVFDMVAFRKTG